MASERAIVFALTGRISPVPSLTAATIGLQPVAWAPWKAVGLLSMKPSFASSPNALPILVMSDPPAMQQTTLAGAFQPSFSAIAKPTGNVVCCLAGGSLLTQIGQ